jgi:3-oxoacyl-[acyl-carrier protein] reductase
LDFGIGDKKALVCASSRGLGRACAEALAGEGVHTIINGRDEARLEATATDFRATHGVEVTTVAGDVTTPAGRQALLEACPEPDILVTNNAGPPPTDFGALDYDDWIRGLQANMVSQLLLIQAVLPAMRRRKFGRIVNITSAMVTSPRPGMALSSGARAGLTAVAKGLSIEVAEDNVTINNLLPERFDTDRQRFMAERVMAAEGIGYDVARRRQEESIAAGRLGDPQELGAMCAFLCSVHTGFVSGNNIHLDGGSYPALI